MREHNDSPRKQNSKQRNYPGFLLHPQPRLSESKRLHYTRRIAAERGRPVTVRSKTSRHFEMKRSSRCYTEVCDSSHSMTRQAAAALLHIFSFCFVNPEPKEQHGAVSFRVGVNIQPQTLISTNSVVWSQNLTGHRFCYNTCSCFFSFFFF